MYKPRSRSRTTTTSKMERFVIIVKGFQPLTIIIKRSILDVAAALVRLWTQLKEVRNISIMNVCWNRKNPCVKLIRIAVTKGVQELVGEVSHHFLQNLKKKYLKAKRSRVYVSFKCNNRWYCYKKISQKWYHHVFNLVVLLFFYPDHLIMLLTI